MHVCIIAEGSYPYVTGGVGKWTHDLIASLSEVEFTVVALWPTAQTAGEPRYRLPRNVRELRHVYLLEEPAPRKKVGASAYARLEEFHEKARQGDVRGFPEICGDVSAARFARDRAAWELVCRLYERCAPAGTPFLDYYWTWRSTHGPMFRVLEERLPECSIVHCISTGYAGLLGAAERLRSGTPLVTTEHGLYTRERWWEIQDAEWIPGDLLAESRRSVNVFKEWWNRIFLGMERIAYQHSDRVVTLFEENRRYQVSHGVPRERSLVIPNGVDLAAFDPIWRRRLASSGFSVALVGRVVPIKDVKTFLAACKLAAERLEGMAVKAYVIGPHEEDAAYARQCLDMVDVLGLGGIVEFTGRVNILEYYGRLDAIALTSLSEGQPLALLEAHACGIPAIATDVGACREILLGRSPEDRELGASGIVTPVADPEATARAIVELARNPATREAMSRAGRARIERYYRWDDACASYRQLYRGLAHGRS